MLRPRGFRQFKPIKQWGVDERPGMSFSRYAGRAAVGAGTMWRDTWPLGHGRRPGRRLARIVDVCVDAWARPHVFVSSL